MTTERTLVERNADFAADFHFADLEIRPRMSTLIIGCVDSRVDPAHLLSLVLGDAVVLRNVGGRVTDEVIQQVKILQSIGLMIADGGTFDFNVALIHHTGCGASLFSMPHVSDALTAALDTGSSVIESLAITDPHESIHNDIDRLRAAAILPDDLVVAGYVYDVDDGHLDQVAVRAPLRATVGIST
ncbi:MAG: carbonic anhydrase [Acidimicrobiia bacterium]|nr:carbonic anhydrase [Acidimicrobiia bacterium]